MNITNEQLNSEFINWVVQFGDGRSVTGLRFIQALIDYYDLNIPSIPDDLYCEESALTTFIYLKKWVKS